MYIFKITLMIYKKWMCSVCSLRVHVKVLGKAIKNQR